MTPEEKLEIAKAWATMNETGGTLEVTFPESMSAPEVDKVVESLLNYFSSKVELKFHKIRDGQKVKYDPIH